MVDEVRDAIQNLWGGRCKITKFDKEKSKNNIVRSVEKVLYENQPCRISHKTISQANQAESFANTIQVIKLFIAPELDIPPGCKIEVIQNGVTKVYQHSGVSAVYTNHQEIILELAKEKA